VIQSLEEDFIVAFIGLLKLGNTSCFIRKEPDMSATVRDLLKTKGNNVWHISPDINVLDALNLMAEKEVGALLVVEDGKILGIVSERDFIRKIADKQFFAVDIPVHEYMTTRVLIVTPDNSIDDCMMLMTDKHIRHLPVVDQGTLVGIISIGDLVKETISERDRTIVNLENYITGRYTT
jgi:CBS domain-containing protein